MLRCLNSRKRLAPTLFLLENRPASIHNLHEGIRFSGKTIECLSIRRCSRGRLGDRLCRHRARCQARNCSLSVVFPTRNLFLGGDVMRIICLQKRWPHHAGVSGYDQLTKFLPAHVINRVTLTSPAGRLIAAAWLKGPARPQYLFDYQLGDRLADEMAFWTSLMRRPDIIHVLYGDEQLHVLLNRSKFLSSSLIATFHLPAESSRERFERHSNKLRQLAGAIVLASSELNSFRRWLGDDKVMYVPHGIDVGKIPIGTGGRSGRLNLVFVGLHMRDFEVVQPARVRPARLGRDLDGRCRVDAGAAEGGSRRQCGSIESSAMSTSFRPSALVRSSPTSSLLVPCRSCA